MENIEHSKYDNDEHFSSTPSSNAMAFTVAFDPEPNSVKSFNLKDSIRKFAPPKPDTIEKQRLPKSRSDLKEMNKSTNVESLKSNEVKDMTGQISDSACYLIQRMLIESDLYNNSESESVSSSPQSNLANKNNNSSSIMVKKSQRSSSAGEKDSGVCDDKSESGTYTIDQNDPDVEVARKKIDQVFGVLNQESNSASFAPPSSYPSSFAALKAIWNSSSQNSNDTLTNGSIKPLNGSLNQSAFVRPKRNSSLDRHSSHSSHNSTPSNVTNHKENLVKSMTSSSKSETEDKHKSSKWYSKQSDNSKSPCKSLSLKRINDLAALPPRFEKYRESNCNQTSFNSFSEDARSLKSDAGSTASTEPDSGGSAKCQSESAEASSSLRFNRAFALRRAKLGMDTLGVPLNLTGSKQNQITSKSASQATPKSSPSLSFNRNDGGRFSLRVSASSNSGKPPIASRVRQANRTPSREDLNKGQNKGRTYSASSDIETSQRCKSPTDSAITSKHFIQKSSSFSETKKDDGKSSKFNSRNYKEISPFEVGKRIFSAKANKMVYCLENSSMMSKSKPMHDFSGQNDLKQSPEVIHFKACSMSERKSSKKELTALDNIVISAIHQLSHKLKNNLQNIIETERDKHAEGSEISLMIQELLPQVLSSEKRFEDVDVSINLSNTLKNLKKVEQSLDVINLLLEHQSIIKSSSDYYKRKNDELYYNSSEYLDEY